MEEARAAVVEAGLRLISDGLVEGTAGNVSVRFGDRVAISPSSIPYHLVRPEDVAVLDLDGNLIGEPGTAEPSSETGLHLGVYRQTGARAVVHHHGIRSVSVSTVVDELPPLHYYVVRLGGAPRVAPYALYGSEKLARAVAAALDGRSAALMQNHGAVTYGGSLDEAFERARLLEWLCDLYLRATAVGRPRVLTDEELAEVAAAFATGYAR
ncbi:class II aldolase/adducin family protein [Actinoplanes sp. NPDC051851]|uniref:class II aldolase/adducin family protein n=1 Tax=Actinoplanes sp. NPDC051851 TaxID=3154753 RepID=UPI0034467C45